MRKLICLFVLTALAVPAQGKLETCTLSEIGNKPQSQFEIDPLAPAWSHEVPAKRCFEVRLENPTGRSCSLSTAAEVVVPEPLDSPEVAALEAPTTSPSTLLRKLGKCEALKIRAQCSAVPGKAPIDKTYTVTTGQCGRWVSHYGVGFLDDENQEFFTSAVTDSMGMPAGFEIKAEADNRSDYETELVVTFTYLPSGGGLGRFGRLGFLGGVGADLDERLVFAGLAFVVGENVNLFVAAAGHMRTHLDGQYEIGQILKQELTPDKLTDDTFSVDLIFGAAFRFDSNPFKKKSTG